MTNILYNIFVNFTIKQNYFELPLYLTSSLCHVTLSLVKVCFPGRDTCKDPLDSFSCYCTRDMSIINVHISTIIPL